MIYIELFVEIAFKLKFLSKAENIIYFWFVLIFVRLYLVRKHSINGYFFDNTFIDMIWFF